MKNRLLSLALSLAILFLFIGNSSFAQNQPEKKDTKSTNQTTQMNNQKDMKLNQNQVAQTNKTQKDAKMNESKTTMYKNTKNATVSKDNKNNEPVNTQYHKKQETNNKGAKTRKNACERRW